MAAKPTYSRNMGPQLHTSIPNPVQQTWEEGPALDLVVKNSGDSVFLEDQDTTFPGMNNPIVTTPACGVYYLAFDYW